MVIGFDKFQSRFEGFSDNYIVIGGSACDWLMQNESIDFRATKDIDLIIIAENMSVEFAKELWTFIRDGGYDAYERADGKKCFYRFLRPKNDGFPFMLEFFSRSPLSFNVAEGSIITPIPIDEDGISSLSGILLDDVYYSFIKKNRRIVDGVSILSPESLIVLKAKAWMDLSSRKEHGEFVKEKDLRKHRTDILRLQAIIPERTVIQLPQVIKENFTEFLLRYEQLPIDTMTLGIPNSFNEAISFLKRIFKV